MQFLIIFSRAGQSQTKNRMHPAAHGRKMPMSGLKSSFKILAEYRFVCLCRIRFKISKYSEEFIVTSYLRYLTVKWSRGGGFRQGTLIVQDSQIFKTADFWVNGEDFFCRNLTFKDEYYNFDQLVYFFFLNFLLDITKQIPNRSWVYFFALKIIFKRKPFFLSSLWIEGQKAVQFSKMYSPYLNVIII